MNVNDTHQSEEARTGRNVASVFGLNRNMNKNIEEELPSMRAVSIQTQQASLQFSTLSGEGKTLYSVNKLSTLESISQKSHGAGVSHEWEHCKWKISVLNEVPVDFPLERTRREIYQVPVAKVVDRITNSLRLLSIEADFDGENAKVKCKTSDMVNFRIRLFAGKATTQEPIIVELQRRSGSPGCFMRVAKKVLDAAEGMEIQPEKVLVRKKVPLCMMKTPVSKMKCLQKIEKQDPHKMIEMDIKKSLEMLRSKKRDVNSLGLENLCYMTDPLKTQPDMASMSCKAMLLGDHWTEIREEIGELLQSDAFLPEEFETHPCKEVFNRCRHLALVFLANLLALTSQDWCLEDAVKNQEWFTEFLIPSLIDEVKSFEISSNNAYEAACGLTVLAKCSDVARKKMKEKSAVGDLQLANHFAVHNHDLLASETKSCLKHLGHAI